jgi:hypothetical protein
VRKRRTVLAPADRSLYHGLLARRVSSAERALDEPPRRGDAEENLALQSAGAVLSTGEFRFGEQI